MNATDKYIPQPDKAALQAVYSTLRQRPALGRFTEERLKAFRAQPRPETKMSHRVQLLTIPGPEAEVPIRIVWPAKAPVAVQLSVHAGGWCMGSADANDWLNDILAEKCQVATVGIDYRLAPEHPYPAALNDILAVATWLRHTGRALFGTDRLLVYGSSAGAHLAAQMLLRLRDEQPDLLARVAAVGLSYGAYDIGKSPSMRLVPDDSLVVRRDVHEGFLDFAFPGLDAEGRRDSTVSPLYARLNGLPPALFTVGSFDPLLDDTLFMAARWQAAGNTAELDVWPECIHLFDAFEPITGRAFAERLSAWFNTFLDRESLGELKSVT